MVEEVESEKQYSAADVFIHCIYLHTYGYMFFNLQVHIDVLVFILNQFQINCVAFINTCKAALAAISDGPLLP